MAQAQRVPYISEEEYLTGEELSVEKHEYVDGQVFAMAGATESHNIISVNVVANLHRLLRGSECRANVNDMKVRVKAINAFYYPDILVSCEGSQPKALFKENPLLIIEIISPSTETIDRREKLWNYRKIASLREYVLIDQNERCVEVYRLNDQSEWVHEIVREEGELELTAFPHGACAIAFDEIYEGVAFPA